MYCDQTKEKYGTFLYHTEYNLVYFSEKNGWWGGDPFYMKFWVNRARWREIN